MQSVTAGLTAAVAAVVATAGAAAEEADAAADGRGTAAVEASLGFTAALLLTRSFFHGPPAAVEAEADADCWAAAEVEVPAAAAVAASAGFTAVLLLKRSLFPSGKTSKTRLRTVQRL